MMQTQVHESKHIGKCPRSSRYLRDLNKSYPDAHLPSGVFRSQYIDEYDENIKQVKKSYTMAKQRDISGGRLNKKDSLTRYGDSHVKDKTS